MGEASEAEEPGPLSSNPYFSLNWDQSFSLQRGEKSGVCVCCGGGDDSFVKSFRSQRGACGYSCGKFHIKGLKHSKHICTTRLRYITYRAQYKIKRWSPLS